MRKRKTKSIVIIFFLCLFAEIVGCNQPVTEKVEITVIHGWGSTESEHVAMRQIYEDFEKEHPEIGLNLVAMPSSTEVIEKVRELLTVGEVPDVIFTGGDGKNSIYNFMVQEGYAVDLLPYIKKDEEFAKNTSSVILDNWKTTDGKLYTISDVLLMGGYWYNKDIFEKIGVEKAPETWEEWFAVCKKIEESDSEVATMILDTDHLSYLMTVLLAEKNCDSRMLQAVNSIRNAQDIIPIPENVWDLSNKKAFGRNVSLFLKEKISKEELYQRLIETE